MDEEDRSSKRARTSKPRVVGRLSEDVSDVEPSRMLPGRKGSTMDDVFGDQAILLGDPQECARPTAAAQSLLNKAVADPLSTRAFTCLLYTSPSPRDRG